MEVIHLPDHPSSSSGIERILKARGVYGVIIAPLPQPGTLPNFPWSEFPLAAVGHSLNEPKVHYVMSHYYHAMEQVVQELRRRGYRRIGLLESEMMEARTERSQSMAFRELLSGQATPSWKKAIQHNDRWTKQNYEQWLQVFRPDAVIASFAHIRDCLIETGVTIPKDLGLSA
ncbi:MAG: hypothetical protein HC904_03420 [Blastochloris sp.]|nr:hypothetical protein [Blastochloris sp.]